MKPLLREATLPTLHSFTVKELVDPHFDPNWHFHPDYQLFLVMGSTGTRFIGDHIKPFEAGDLVFLGPNMPHLWRNDHAYFENRPELYVHGIVVYFTEDFLGKEFFEKQEMLAIKAFFERAQRGLDIYGATRDWVAGQMLELTRLEGFDSVLQLLRILNRLAHSTDYSCISSLGYVNGYRRKPEAERMRKVHAFVMNHFQKPISLRDVAAIASMSPAAFCRYFKARTNKSFSDFISEIRIGHACKLLIEERMNVTQIGYECGFRTLSNFNRQFKAITKASPLQYQRQYVKSA